MSFNEEESLLNEEQMTLNEEEEVDASDIMPIKVIMPDHIGNN